MRSMWRVRYTNAMKLSGKRFLFVIAALVVAAIAATGYRYLVRGDFPFYVEAPCDPEAMTCFVRDCFDPDSCPPNGLAAYRSFRVSASDFARCGDNSCLNLCASGDGRCVEIACGAESGDHCSR